MTEQPKKPILSCAAYEDLAEQQWRPYYKSLPLAELWAEAGRIQANTYKLKEYDRVKLINRLIRTRRAEAGVEWSRKISSGDYRVEGC